MDKPRNQQLFQQSMESGYGNGSVPQPSFVPDQAGSTSANLRPPNSNASDVKQHYSIQTGEEFALEFMRDRVVPQMSSNANAAGDMNHTTGYMELRDLIGISHAVSDCASDVSKLSIGENGMREFGNKLGHVQSAPPASISKDNNLRNLHGYSSASASGSVAAKVKILCSYGGKILPRPGDSKLIADDIGTHIDNSRAATSQGKVVSRLFFVVKTFCWRLSESLLLVFLLICKIIGVDYSNFKLKICNQEIEHTQKKV